MTAGRAPLAKLPAAARRRPLPCAPVPPRAVDAAPRARPILILGIERSGTSLLSEIVWRWGAYGGEAELLEAADRWNPRGYWQFRPMANFLVELTQSADVAVWEPSFKQRVRQLARQPAHREKAQALVAGMESSGAPWFWKEPIFAHSLPFWQEVLDQPICLVTLRNPLDAAMSFEQVVLPAPLQGRIRLVAYFLLRWQYVMLSLLGDLAGWRHKLVVSYEALVTSPRDECARIRRFLDVAAAAGGPESAEKVERMAQAVEPSLWRQVSEIPLAQCADASPEQRDLFSYLSSRLDGDFGDFDPARYPLPPCWREYLENFDVCQRLFGSL
jgi:hypothetical protein